MPQKIPYFFFLVVSLAKNFLASAPQSQHQSHVRRFERKNSLTF
nr:MAG TPA: hypothetical protein [Caudoviricetes sp.]